jgi:hypothetical protein
LTAFVGALAASASGLVDHNQGVLNPNRATQEELAALPQLGKSVDDGEVARLERYVTLREDG